MKKIKVNLEKKSYNIVVGINILKEIPLFIKHLEIGNNAVIITNACIKRLFGEKLQLVLKKKGISSTFLIVPDSEKSKSEKITFTIIKKIAELDKKKGIFVIAFGGGVIGDLSGFIASIYKRGVPFIQIPTTLLAQVDSSIGGKAAIDLEVAKNLVGSFYQPKIVFSDISLLKTLPTKQVLNGLGEIIKYGIIKDKKLFNFVEKNLNSIINDFDEKVFENIVYTCSKIKAGYVEKDEFDSLGIRAELNFGHTIGHAVEAASHFSKQYNHGESVAFGIVVEAEIANKLGLMNIKNLKRITNLIQRAGLPLRIKGLRLKNIINATLYDKKIIHGVNRFILPLKIGKVKIAKNISLKLINEVLKKRVE